jgi:hypothetical protein
MKQRDIDALVAAITHLIDVRISRDQGMIGVHERVTAAQTNLRASIARAIGMKESAEP